MTTKQLIPRNCFLLPLLGLLIAGAGASFFDQRASHAAANPLAEAKTDLMVRVLVLEEKRSVNLTIKGSYRIWALPSGRLLKSGSTLAAEMVAPTAAGLRLGK